MWAAQLISCQNSDLVCRIRVAGLCASQQRSLDLARPSRSRIWQAVGPGATTRAMFGEMYLAKSMGVRVKPDRKYTHVLSYGLETNNIYSTP